MELSGQTGCIRKKVVVFGQSGCIRAKWLYSGKMVVFGKKVVIYRAKWLNSCKSGCIRSKVVVFGQKCLYSGKVVVIGQNGSIRAKYCFRPKVVVL